MLSLLRRTILGSTERPAAPERGRSDTSGVIVVDDSLGVQNVVSQIVMKAGLSSSCATSLDDVKALDIGRSAPLVLLDLSLHRSDAIDVIRYLAGIGFRGTIALMSGQDAAVVEYVAAFGRQHGLEMLPTLTKPFRADALRAILARHGQRTEVPIEIDFDEILAQRRLEVWYQPRVYLCNFLIGGFEALVRIRHPREGLLLPGRFMNHLSDADMGKLTAHVLLQTISTWERLARIGFVLKASMNVRAHELVSPTLIEILKASSPDDPRWSGLVMELREPKLVNEVEAVREAVVRLRLHKVDLALDDFEALAGGLVTCPELKLSEIGVDHRFVSGCAKDRSRLAICEAAVRFGKKSGMRVVAEGVETEDDMLAVRALGFELAQGNLFSAAVPYATLEALLRKREPMYGTASKMIAAH